MKTYFVEFTDTFAGEANYCWVDRFKIKAKNIKKAITKAKQARYYSPVPKHVLSDYGDSARIDIIGGTVCAFIDEWEDETHGQYLNVKEVN